MVTRPFDTISLLSENMKGGGVSLLSLYLTLKQLKLSSPSNTIKLVVKVREHRPIGFHPQSGVYHRDVEGYLSHSYGAPRDVAVCYASGTYHRLCMLFSLPSKESKIGFQHH